MDRTQLGRLLRKVRSSSVSIESALEQLADLATGEIGFARIDHHRTLRRGMPEVVFGQGKSIDQLEAIVAQLATRRSAVLATRLDAAKGNHLAARFPRGVYDAESQTFLIERSDSPPLERGLLIVTAGTADRPVAKEAEVTARAFGLAADRLDDVGVAGVHRLLAETRRLRRARVIVVVAGMEGALPSVVTGLVDCPVIGVPTSVGYGVGAGGVAPLIGMLASCAGGLTVVNIDNGFGAACAARAILAPGAGKRKPDRGR